METNKSHIPAADRRYTESARMSSGHNETAGDWARNSDGQGVWANDQKLVFKNHTYFCYCGCGDIVTLKRSEWARLTYRAQHICTGIERSNEMKITGPGRDVGLGIPGISTTKKGKRAHFAYKSQHRRNECKGTNGCNETEIHYNAKWLLQDIFKQVKFWRVCWRGHHVGPAGQYTGPEWTATVEKLIPGTKKKDKPGRVADVLLENSITKESIALEVHHTNAVSVDKKTECEEAGVFIIQVNATHLVHGKMVAAINPDCHDLNNELYEYECDECCQCVKERQKEQAREKAYRAWYEQNERDRRELEDMEREQLRLDNEAKAEKRIEQERRRQETREREEAERIEQERMRQETREREEAEERRVQEEARIERERLQQVIKARDRANREDEAERRSQRESARQDARRKFLDELRKLERSLVCANAKLRISEIINQGNRHGFTPTERTHQLEEYNTNKGVVENCEHAIELHKDSGRGNRSRRSMAAAGCIACAGSIFRCVTHDDHDTYSVFSTPVSSRPSGMTGQMETFFRR